jgi:hypothetical protein
MKLDPYLSPVTKTSSKLIKHLNARPETISLRRNLLQCIGIGKEFFDKTAKIEKKRQKKTSMTIEKCLQSKGNNHRM